MEDEIAQNIVPIIVMGTLGLFTFFGGVLTFIILYQKKVIKTQKEKQSLETSYQKEMLHTYIETQEKERSRIASDLHDNIGASLGAVKMMMNQITGSTDKEKELIEECKSVIQSTAESSREISHNLLPPTLERLGIVRVIERMTKNISNDDLKATLQTSSNLNLSKDQELALFRITQEMISNSLKYSKAKQISISIMEENKHVNYKYSDDGVGFSTKNSEGLGLKNIITRVEMIKGQHRFFSNPNVESGVIIEIIQQDD